VQGPFGSALIGTAAVAVLSPTWVRTLSNRMAGPFTFLCFSDDALLVRARNEPSFTPRPAEGGTRVRLVRLTWRFSRRTQALVERHYREAEVAVAVRFKDPY
jgi:hypothetical protein